MDSYDKKGKVNDEYLIKLVKIKSIEIMTSYPALQVGGDLNPCYFYFQELRYCA